MQLWKCIMASMPFETYECWDAPTLLSATVFTWQIPPTSQDILVNYFEWLESSSPSPNETFEDKNVGEPSVRVSVQLFHWQPTKISFKPTEVSLFHLVLVSSTKISISPAGLCQLAGHPSLCLFSTSLKWETMPTWNWCFHSDCNFSIPAQQRLRGRSCETWRKSFYAQRYKQLLYCKQPKKLSGLNAVSSICIEPQ